MKKLLTIIALTVLNTGIYAQKVFDETVFNGMMSRLQTDPAFFKNEVDPGFIITFGNGATTNQESMLKYAENNIGLYKPKYSNLKVSQYGNTGIVTGTNEETFLSKANPSVVSRTSKHLFTYTFTKIKNNWIWVAGQHTDIPTPFTKETLNEIMTEYKADSKAFFANRISDDFRYPLQDGNYLDRAAVTSWEKSNIVNSDYVNPIIFQSGDLAVVTGMHFTEHGVENATKPRTDKAAATYTFQRRNGKWMFVASHQTNITATKADEEAIKELIMKEVDALNKKGNLDDYLSCYANSADVRFGPYKGKMINLDELKKVAETVIKSNSHQNDSYEHEDWNIKINGNSAFVTSKQISTRANGQKDNAYKADYLTKIGNDWKIVHHRYNLQTNNTVEQEEEAIKNVIEGETMAGRERNTEKEFSFWNPTPTTSFVGAYNNTAMYTLGFDNIKTQVADYHKKNPAKVPIPPIKNSDYVIKINANNAFVTYKAETKENGKLGLTRENRYLEKVGGIWKISNVTWIVDKVVKK